MKRTSQISVAIVCAILGFMLSYQFKTIIKQEKTLNLTSKNNTDITVEIEQYKKDKKEMEKKVKELEDQIKNYEQSAAEESDSNKNLLKELDNTRILTGTTDVQGPGVTIYLNPLSNIFGSTTEEHLTDKHLVYIINELRFAGAEAIAVNGIRVVNRTGIRTAGNYILLNNDEKISPSSRITIEAIGDKNLLYSTLSFPEVFVDFKGICDVKYEKTDELKIKKYNKVYKYQFAKPVKNQ